MSLLTIAQAVADEVGFKRPTAVVGSTDTIARQLLRLVRKEGQETSQEYDWTALRSETSLTLVASQQQYSLPSDFRGFIIDSGWDRTNLRQLTGPISSVEWQEAKGIGVIPAIHRRFRISNDRTGPTLTFLETVGSDDAGDSIYLEYLSSYWIESAGGTALADFAADSDVLRLDQEIITRGAVWRFKRAKGLDWQADWQDYVQYKEAAKGRDSGAMTIRPWPSNWLGDPRVPEGDFPDA